jgi:hypothetical protein
VPAVEASALEIGVFLFILERGEGLVIWEMSDISMDCIDRLKQYMSRMSTSAFIMVSLVVRL